VNDAALSGKIAVVSGASRGIGLAVAGALHGAGAHVVRLARSLGDASAERRTDLRCDVSDPEAVARTGARILDALGVPDVLVNNAGQFFIKPFQEIEPEEFQRTLAINLTGAFLMARTLVPPMVRRGSGHVVTVGSVSDHVAYSGSGAYAASKYGLRGLHEILRVELSKTGVRTTLLSPGPVDTDIWDPIDPDSKPGFTKRRDMLCAEDVAAAALYAVTQPQRVDVTEIRLMPTVYAARS